MHRLRNSRIGVKVGLIIASFVVMVLAIITGTVSADTHTQNITLSPTSADQTLNAGSSNKGVLRVINNGNSSFTFNVNVSPYRVVGENYTQEFTMAPGATNVASWFQIGIQQLTLDPGKSADIPYTINVPNNTPAGGYYAIIFAKTQSQATDNGVVVINRVGEIFYITVAGPIVQQGKVVSWRSAFFQQSPMSSSVKIENDGGTHFLATINITAKDVFGRTVFIYNTKKEVLSQTIRQIKSSWQSAPSFGIFRVSGTANFLNQTHVLQTKYVIIMSRTVRIVCLVVLIAIAAGIILKRTTKRKIRRYKTK